MHLGSIRSPRVIEIQRVIRTNETAAFWSAQRAPRHSVREVRNNLVRHQEYLCDLAVLTRLDTDVALFCGRQHLRSPLFNFRLAFRVVVISETLLDELWATELRLQFFEEYRLGEERVPCAACWSPLPLHVKEKCH